MLVLLILNAGALLAALLLAQALAGATRAGLLLPTACVYLLLVHSATLTTGLLGVLAPAGLLAATAIAVAGAWWLRRRVTVPADVGPHPARITPAAAFAPALASVAAAAWAWPHLVEGTRLWIWDDYTYHMVYPARWLSERAIAAVAPPHAFTMQAWYPLSADTIATWFMAPFARVRGEALAWVSLTALLYAAMIGGACIELCRRLGRRPGAWAVPVALLVTSPRIGIMASSFSDADLAQAAALFAAVIFAAPRRDGERAREVVADAILAALLTGFALGVKVSALPPAVVVTGMLALRARRRAVVRRVLAIVPLAWLVTAGYWYVRNVLHTGNPVYPAAWLFGPGATFTSTTLREYGERYGLARTLADAAVVYLDWPRAHAYLALAGLAGLTLLLLVPRGSMTRPCAYFAGGALAITVVVLGTLPFTPYSAGNPMTFAAGLVHWDSMRYVALLPILGWAALGVLLDAGAGAPPWRILVAIVVTTGAVLGPGRAPPWLLGLAAVATLAVMVLTVAGRRARLVVGAAAALATTWGVVVVHEDKAKAIETALYQEPLVGAAAAVLDRQPDGTRVAIFGDQWVYPAFGARHHLRPVRLDGDGRLATEPVGATYEPGPLTVDAATLRRNLAGAGVTVVIVLRLPHPGRLPQWPSQAAALDALADAHPLHRSGWMAVWRLGD